MTRFAKLALIGALAVGPTAAWLVWAIQQRRPVQIGLAIAANIALWLAGPALLAWEMENLL